MAFWSALSALVLCGVPSARAVDALDVGSFPSGAGAACGCFAWSGVKAFADGKLVYQEFETTHEKNLRMMIDGKVVNLKKSPEPKKDKFLSAQEGGVFEENLAADNCSVKAVWKATKVNSSEEESARNIYFKVTLSVKKGKRSKKLAAVGYCGC